MGCARPPGGVLRWGQPLRIWKCTTITFQLSSATPPRVAGLKRHLASARRFVSVKKPGLSVLIGSRAAIANIVFSCALIGASLLFFALCSLVGALGATLLLLR